MLNYNIVEGSLLNAEEEYILHQCNCITRTTGGLSQAISQKFPYAHPYKNRPNVPGTICVFEKEDKPKIIALYAQRGVGIYSGSPKDRLEWFEECLNRVAELDPKTVAIPYGIGCGMAGGNWNDYEKIITDWGIKHNQIIITIYKM